MVLLYEKTRIMVTDASVNLRGILRFRNEDVL